MKRTLLLICTVFLLLILVSSLVLTSCGSPASSTSTVSQSSTSQSAAPKPVEIAFAHMFPPQSPEGQVANKWADKIKEDSKGLLSVRIYPVGTLLAPNQIYDGVFKGAAGAGMAYPYAQEGFELSAAMPSILTAPNTAIAAKVYDDLWKQFPDVMANEWKDVKILWMTPGALQTFWITKPRFQTLEDFKGLQIRVPSKEMGSVVKALGAIPVSMSTADTVVALDKGTIDGAYTLHATVASNKMTSLKYGLKLNNMSCGVASPVFCVMNKDVYKSLTPDLQKVVDDSLVWGKQVQLETWSSVQATAEKWFTNDNGGEYISLSKEQEDKFAALYYQAINESVQAMVAKGIPATEIVNYIRERIKFYQG